MYRQRMNLNDKLSRRIFVQEEAKVPDVFGVEVELEGRNISNPPVEVQLWWKPYHDGSLRRLTPGDETMEYISKVPYNIQHTQKSIQVLFAYLNGGVAQVYPSYRTSIHVHVNFSQETYRTTYNAMTLSLILDELLVSKNGDHRVGNNFCLRAKDAMGQVVGLIQSIEAGTNFFEIVQNDRYSSINFASLLKFGSIEYRSQECHTHEGRLMHWINTLQQIKQAAKPYKNPVEIIQDFSRLAEEEFLRKVLGPYAAKYLNVAGYQDMLRSGMRIAQDLAYCSSWNEGSDNE